MNYIRKKWIFSLFSFLISFVAKPQTNVSLGTPYGVVDATDKFYFHKGNEIMTVKITRKEVTIQKLNSDKLKFEKIHTSQDFPEKYSFELIKEFNGRYFFFYSLWDKEQELEQLFYKEIDFTKGDFINGDKLLVKVKGKIVGNGFISNGWYSFSITNKFDFQFSKDDEKMLIQYRLKPEIRDDAKSYDIIGMNVFDKNLNPVWNKLVTMPYTEKKMNNLDYSVDKEGNIYMLTMIFDDNTTSVKKKKGEDDSDDKDKPNYHIELLKVGAGSIPITATPIKMGDKFINKIYLFETTDNSMLCAGFYNNGKNANAVNGIFLFKLSIEGKVYDEASYEIPLEILNMYISERAQKKNEKKDAKGDVEFQNLELRDLKITEDGSIVLIGEQYFVQSHTTSSNGRTYTYYTYHYYDMLLTKIDPNGKLAYMKKLPKRQIGKMGRGGMSYQYMFSGNNHYLIFLDHENNMQLTTDKYPSVHNDGAGGFLTAYKINDKNGNIEKISLLDTRDVQGMEVYQFQTSRILPISDNKFVVEVYKKKKEDILIKVDLGK